MKRRPGLLVRAVRTSGRVAEKLRVRRARLSAIDNGDVVGQDGRTYAQLGVGLSRRPASGAVSVYS